MKSSLLECSQSASAHAPLDRRYAERVPIEYRVSYTGTEGARLITIQGSLKDLSKTGCQIRGTVLPSAGDTLTVTLYLEDGGAPLCLTDATVSWIKGSVFAIRFPKLSDSERNRLQTVIWKHVTLTHAKTYRTAFRIVS